MINDQTKFHTFDKDSGQLTTTYTSGLSEKSINDATKSDYNLNLIVCKLQQQYEQSLQQSECIFKNHLQAYIDRIIYLEQELEKRDQIENKQNQFNYDSEKQFETDDQMTSFYNSIKVMNDKIKFKL